MQHTCRTRWTLAAVAWLAAAAAAPMAAAAQGVRGVVTDSASGRAVEGVQVLVVGTTRGTITNADGAYTIGSVPAGERTLRFRRVGYQQADRQVTVASGGTVTLDVTLVAAPARLAEEVVVGYGTQQRQNLSTAISSVTSADIENTPLASVDGALQGKVPGLQVVQNAGTPGNGISVRVRGSASLSASNQPLFVIDGVPMITGDYSQLSLGGQDMTMMGSLNPDEIESIDILKDAAAAAIYGSRGSNGVVLITTKRGRSGQREVRFNAYTGIQQVSKTVDLLNARDYMIYRNEARVNDGRAPLFTEAEIMTAQTTDWQDAVFRTAPVTDVNLSVSGGSDRIQYFASGSLFDQDGVALGSAFNRQAGRLNVDMAATDRLQLRASVGLSRDATTRIQNDNTIVGVVTNGLALQPYLPIRRDDGEFTDTDDGLAYPNPVAIGEFNTAESRTLRGFGSVEANMSLSEQLRLTGRLGVDIFNLRDLRWYSPRVGGQYAASVGGVAQMGNTTAHRYLAESYATFSPRVSGTPLELVAGASVEYNDAEDDFIEGEEFPSDRLRYPGSAGRVTDYDGGSTGYNLVSFFSRANANIGERFILSGAFRFDGSSRFGENNKYGVFPSASVAWMLGNESFFRRFEALSELKLRASFGVTGNQELTDDNFASKSRYGRANYGEEAGLGPTGLANPDLKWETTQEYDIGLDAQFFNGRLGFVADYYRKKTNDLLIERPIPSEGGLTTTWSNIGGIENKGWELAVNSTNVRPSDANGFRWESNFNVAANRNRVTELFDDQPFTTGFYNRVQEGQPLGAFYTLRFLGVDPLTGDAIFDDVNGDGEITADDETIVGSPHPDYFGGIGNTLSWRGLSLRAFVQFALGQEIFNAMREFADDGGRFSDNKFADVMKRWQQPGDITNVPRASSRNRSGAGTPSSRWIEDGSYWRLQELTVSYNLPRRISSLAGLRESRVFLTGYNLFTWTDYTGYSPEANSGGSNTNTFLGTDYYAAPLARTFSIGVSGAW